jgi:segregation and condensation protein A
MGPFGVKVNGYSGPLDLLLLLVEQQEVDICLISLSRVTRQFCEYIRVIGKIDMEEAIGYLILAAQLVEIKSESMLPKVDLVLESVPEAQGEAIDSREDLLRQLEQYRKYRDAALDLMGMAGRHEKFRSRKPVDISNLPPSFQPVELWDLVSAYARLLRETNPEPVVKIREEYLPLEVLMRQTVDLVTKNQRMTLMDLVRLDASRARLIGIFLAVLELIKLGNLVAVQERELGEILIVDPESMPTLRAA